MNAFLIWDIIESKVDTLTLPVLFNRGIYFAVPDLISFGVKI